MQAETEIRSSEERPRDANVKVRQDDAQKERIPLGSNEPLSLHASSSETAVLKVQTTGSDCYFLNYSSSIFTFFSFFHFFRSTFICHGITRSNP